MTSHSSGQNRTNEAGLAHPIDLVTKFVARQDWQVRERNHDAVLAEVPGRWSDYQLAVTWRRFDETMQVLSLIHI